MNKIGIFIKIFFIFLLGSVLFANNSSEYYNSLTKNLSQNIEKVRSDFSYLKPKINAILKTQKKYSPLEDKAKKYFFNSLEKKINNLKYVKGNFLNKKEFQLMKKKAISQLHMMKNFSHKGIAFLFFLTSSSVPNKVISNWLLETAILERANIPIYPIIYTRGFGKNFKKYFFNLAQSLKQNIPEEYVPYIKQNFRFKLGPQFFKYFHLKRVPAIVLAICNNLSPMPEDCDIKYIMKGDMHLSYFFDKISKVDNNLIYKKYYRILIANNIVNYNNKQRNKHEKDNINR